jgi:hypothetical protein
MSAVTGATRLQRILRLRSQPALEAEFFHLYMNDGGGGERVLWCVVRAVQELRPDLSYFVFTGDDDASLEGLEACALDRFGVRLLCPTQVPPLLPVHRRVPHPGLPLLAGSRSGGARRGGRPTGAESGVARQGGQGAVQRHQEAQRRGEHCQLPL